eukprot:TRINITY_DN69440_c0_g1_i1.p1 TRINITY_DN69440_c0_g1~~TRINITY_DN69440_c0_g1_i1.p1  ORF type:complete len:123 (+),score=29.81 TRINITY_DN69440_c0_g1_i1:68-436(+)
MAPVVTLAERQAAQRADKLEKHAVSLLMDLKKAAKTAHALGRRELTWGAVVPAITCGSDEDMDDILAALDRMIAEDAREGGFQKVEWCKAKAPTQWVDAPARFGSHLQLRVFWSDAADEYLS